MARTVAKAPSHVDFGMVLTAFLTGWEHINDLNE